MAEGPGESDTDPRSPDPNGGGAIGTPASDAAFSFLRLITSSVSRLASAPAPEPDVVADVACGPVAETRSTIAVSEPPDAPATTPPTARATVAPWPMSCSQGDSDAMALSARGAGAAAAAAAAAARSDASASANARTRRARSRGVGSAASRETPSLRSTSSRLDAPSPRRRRVCSSARRAARDGAFSVFDSAVFDSAESKTKTPRAADSYSATRADVSAFHDPSRPITSVSAVASDAVAFAVITSKSSPRRVSARARLSGADPEAARESGSRAPELDRDAASAGTPKISTCGSAVTVGRRSFLRPPRFSPPVSALNTTRTTRCSPEPAEPEHEP